MTKDILIDRRRHSARNATALNAPGALAKTVFVATA
jgi:hypothetical protein